MWRQTITIKKHKVLFVWVNDCVGWFANINNKDHGSFVRLDKSVICEKFHKSQSYKDIIDILADQAEETINKLITSK